ncbi:hypothetical protein [Pseudomonas sp. Irchel s3b6]|uniref:hypothetical protein n=1 Tax=Pseudomonas sp. Irchel s3b6 TaxID=2009078 RepID=UPI0015952E2F|nr:hypothetical protein [Pseudomonas sp. Irchel s3b6]
MTVLFMCTANRCRGILSEASGSEDQINAAFNTTLATLESRCRAFLQLPFDRLDAAARQRELERIATL